MTDVLSGMTVTTADVPQITAITFTPGQGRRTTLIEDLAPRREGEVLWLDLDLTGFTTDTPDEVASHLYESVADACPGANEDMFADLLVPDLWPKVQAHGSDGRVRAVSAARVWAAQPPPSLGPTSSKAGALGFQLVEFLAGEGWIISAWHVPELYQGSEGRAAVDDFTGATAQHRLLDEAWSTGRAHTAGDLGVLMLQAVADTYSTGSRALYDWLEEWEVDFYRRCGPDSATELERQTLIELRAHVYRFRKCLSAINAPQVHVRTFWFSDASDREAAERLDDTVDRTLRRLTELSDRLRSAFDLLQLQLSQLQGRRTERLQQRFDLIASVLLVPTLIAGLYGANTAFPGRDTAWGSLTMVLLMAVGGIATYAVLVLRRRRQ